MWASLSIALTKDLFQGTDSQTKSSVHDYMVQHRIRGTTNSIQAHRDWHLIAVLFKPQMFLRKASMTLVGLYLVSQ